MADEISAESEYDIIAKLKFISKINKEMLIDVGTMTISGRSWRTSIYRTLVTFCSREESRDKTLEFLKVTTSVALSKLKALNTRDAVEGGMAKLILKSLQEAKGGIRNISETYKEDTMFSSRIETLLETLEVQIDNVKKL